MGVRVENRERYWEVRREGILGSGYKINNNNMKSIIKKKTKGGIFRDILNRVICFSKSKFLSEVSTLISTVAPLFTTTALCILKSEVWQKPVLLEHKFSYQYVFECYLITVVLKL